MTAGALGHNLCWMPRAPTVALALALASPAPLLAAAPEAPEAAPSSETARATHTRPPLSRERSLPDDARTPSARRDLYRPLVPADYGLLGFLGVLRLSLELIGPPSSTTWAGPLLLDESVRDTLRATSQGGRKTAATASDLLVASTYVWAASDVLIAGGLGERPDWDLKWKLFVIDLQAIALASSVTEIGKWMALRARPDVEPCASDPDYSKGCGVEVNESFPSGHSSSSAVAAGLVCAHHLTLELYGSRAADLSACVASSALAVTAGTMRIVADRHYATDVVAGLLLGGSIGVAWPLLFHAPRSSSSAASIDAQSSPGALRVTLLPVPSPGAPSLQLFGQF